MAPSILIETSPMHAPSPSLADLKAPASHGPVPNHYAPVAADSHLEVTRQMLNDASHDRPTVLDGYTLSPGSVVRTAKRGAMTQISTNPALIKRVAASVAFLEARLHTSIYGVNTGFGGSADQRTDAPMALQQSLLEHQLAGVLPLDGQTAGVGTFETIDPMTNAMPEAVCRAAILIRINSLVRGHSGVRLDVLKTLEALLNKHITPMVPLRGSISASGDLQPLGYIAAAICGHPDVRVFDRSSGSLQILPAPVALARHGIEPVVLAPKEGLGLINGTAFSAAAACLAAHDAHALALLGQALTAMGVEAMVGQAGSFHPFIHDVARPHPGQCEAARNILGLLQGSRLAVHSEEVRQVADEMDQNVLRQDRYPLRTSPQWLGPQLEELLGVHKTLSCEINSTTDNPLLDVEGGHSHHGGNFQSTHAAVAMEKTRLALYMLGKLAFAQTTEIINTSMNKGLPSCLAGDEPSTNYHAKGLDINLAAYTSELAFLASPVITHVQSAEQHNQAVNSMALVSARYTIQAVEVLSMLMSAQLYTLCMACDLRVMDLCFRQAFADSMPGLVSQHFGSYLEPKALDALVRAALACIYRRLEHTASMDTGYRFADAFNHTTSVIVDALASSPVADLGNPIAAIASWKQASAQATSELYRTSRDRYFEKDSAAADFLGGTAGLYLFVRRDLGIKARRGDVFAGGHQHTIGSDVSKIHHAIRSGRLYSVLKSLF